jgi:hypothetical protein
MFFNYAARVNGMNYVRVCQTQLGLLVLCFSIAPPSDLLLQTASSYEIVIVFVR